MTDIELTKELSKRLNWSLEQLEEVMGGVVEHIASQLSSGRQLTIDGLGLFTTRKKKERILVHSETEERHLMPPVIEVLFVSAIEDSSEQGWQNNNRSLIQTIANTLEIETKTIEHFFHQLTYFITEQMGVGHIVEYPNFGTFSPIIDNNEEGIRAIHVNFLASGLLQEIVNKPFSHFEPVLLDQGVIFEEVEEVIKNDSVVEKEKEPSDSMIKVTIATAAEELPGEVEPPEPLIDNTAVIDEVTVADKNIVSDEIETSESLEDFPLVVVRTKKENKINSKLKRAIEKYPVLAPIIGGLLVAVVAVFSISRRE